MLIGIVRNPQAYNAGWLEGARGGPYYRAEGAQYNALEGRDPALVTSAGR
jgi:hypothetical protein